MYDDFPKMFPVAYDGKRERFAQKGESAAEEKAESPAKEAKEKRMGKEYDAAHPGFKAIEAKIGKEKGIRNPGAVLAAATRRASPAAKKANPRLKRVRGALHDGATGIGVSPALGPMPTTPNQPPLPTPTGRVNPPTVSRTPPTQIGQDTPLRMPVTPPGAPRPARSPVVPPVSPQQGRFDGESIQPPKAQAAGSAAGMKPMTDMGPKPPAMGRRMAPEGQKAPHQPEAHHRTPNRSPGVPPMGRRMFDGEEIGYSKKKGFRHE